MICEDSAIADFLQKAKVIVRFSMICLWFVHACSHLSNRNFGVFTSQKELSTS